MKILRGPDSLPASLPTGSVVAVGTFDGVHIGHAAVLAEVVRWAKELRAVPAAVVFVRPPRVSLPDAAPLDLLTSPEHRLQFIARLGIELALDLEFGDRLAGLSAEEFARTYLLQGLGARALVMGHDARLGKGGAGDFPAMKKIGARLGLEVRQTRRVRACRQVVSSSAVRRAIQEGRLDVAECLLGRRVSVLGTVVPGLGHGRELGFPTVNLDIHREVRPPMGVYATLARVEDGPALKSVSNVGFRPTAARSKPRGLRRDLLVEAHLLEGGGDLYGRLVELEFVKKLREERRFDSDTELAAQIALDAEEARRLLASSSDCRQTRDQ